MSELILYISKRECKAKKELSWGGQGVVREEVTEVGDWKVCM